MRKVRCVEIAITAILAVLVGLALGATAGYFGKRIILGKRLEAAQSEASRVLEQAEEERRDVLLKAKEDALQLRSAGEEELRDRRAEV